MIDHGTLALADGGGAASGAQPPRPVPALRVAIDLPLRAGDAAFTFAPGAAAGAQRGDGVIVPFGRRLVPGIVLGGGEWRPDLRPALALVEGGPLIPPATVDLAEWVSGEFLSSVGEALVAALPWEALWAGVRLQAVGSAAEGAPAAAHAAVEALRLRPATLVRTAALLRPAWDDLEHLAEVRAFRVVLPAPVAGARDGARPTGASSAGPPDSPTAPEGTAFRGVYEAVGDAMAGHVPRGLLIAGWRRTPAYLSAITHARAAGWSCIASFPMVDAALAFADAARAAGIEPLVLHGDLEAASRLSAWRAARGVRGGLVVGTRAAIFAPVRDPVLAIVDDEDGTGHKEERAPRYTTRAIAQRRTAASGVLVIGSFTPTVSSFGEAQAGRLRLIALPSPRARLGVVDLRRRPDPDRPVSRAVMDAVARVVRRRGRAVLLVDRKGYAGLQCRECGRVERCPVCAVALRYERERRRLLCRYCGRIVPAPVRCAQCGGVRFAPLGAGTERIARAIRQLTRLVFRLDRDVLPPRQNILAALQPFRARGGVLVATQIIMPWIGALAPDLVAFLAADRWLHRPEFRAAERALGQLRAGGAASREPVLVETSDPQHPAITAAQAHGLRPFYAGELALRETLGYPPARTLVVCTVTARAGSSADAVAGDLTTRAPEGIEVFGPMPLAGAPPRWEIVIKARDRRAAQALLYPLLIGRGLPRGVRVAADVDPHEV